MPTGPPGILHHLRRAALLHEGGPADGPLLECFRAHRDEAAFAALVRRHGPMVLGVCRRVLGNVHDAEDAFQATFLVLARKAAGLRLRRSLSNWLYGVAHLTALKARAAAMKRRAKESQAPPRTETEGPEVRDWLPLLDQELSRLPDKYRAAVVLCDLEGKTRKEAAGLLGVPEGTLSGRLTTAHRLLARRLARHGLAPAAGAVAVVLVQASAPACVPAALMGLTVQVAGGFAAGQAAVAVAPRATALAEGVLKTMFLNKLKLAAALVCVAGAVVTAGVLACPAGGADPAPKGPQQAARAADPPPAPSKAPAILKQAREAAEAIEDQQHKAWALQAIAEEQAKAGDRDAAARTFRDAIAVAKEIRSNNVADPTAPARHTLTHIAEAQAQAGDLKAARQTAGEIADDGARDHALALVASAQARAGDLTGALEAAQTLSARTRDWVFAAAAVTQAKAGKVQEASQTAAKIADDTEHARALVAVAKAQAKDDRRKTLQEALKLAANVAAEFDGRHMVRGFVVQVLAEAGEVDEARKTADAITKEPWKGIALGHVAAAQAKAGDVKEALRTADAVEGRYYQGSAAKGVVVAQLRAGDVKGALQTAGAIKNAFWRVEALAEVAKAQARAGDGAAAADTFKRAFAEAGTQGGKVLDEEPGLGNLRNAALCRIVQAQAEAGLEKEAVAWASDQAAPHLRAQALTSIAQGLTLRKEAEQRPPK